MTIKMTCIIKKRVKYNRRHSLSSFQVIFVLNVTIELEDGCLLKNACYIVYNSKTTQKLLK